MENIFHKKDRKQYFHSQDNFYSTTLNSEKKNKKKRNIKNTNKNNLKSKTISSDIKLINNLNYDLSQKIKSSLQKTQQNLGTNFSEGDRTTSSQSIYSFNKTYLTDYQKTFSKRNKNIKNINPMKINSEIFNKNYKPIIKIDNGYDNYVNYKQYDRKKIIEVRNKVHDYLTSELHKKVKSIDYISSRFNYNYSNFNEINDINNYLKNNDFNYKNEQINNIYKDNNIYKVNNNIEDNNNIEENNNIYNHHSNNNFDIDNKSNVIYSERKNDKNIFNKNNNVLIHNNNKFKSKDFNERNDDLKKFLNFTDKISTPVSINKNTNSIQRNKDSFENKKKINEKKMNLKYSNPKLSNYPKLKFNLKRIKSNNKKPSKVNSTNNIDIINQEKINYTDLIKKNNLKKDNKLNDNKNEMDNKNRINQKNKYNELLNYRKLSIKSEENYKLSLNNNAQEYIEEKLKFIKSKMSHSN